MVIRDNKFSYSPKGPDTPHWSPDIDLTTLQPPQKSLNATQYKQYHLYQKILQHIHMEMQYHPNTSYNLTYIPSSTQPQGVAGIPAAVLTLELLLKEYLVADRYATHFPQTHPSHRSCPFLEA